MDSKRSSMELPQRLGQYSYVGSIRKAFEGDFSFVAFIFFNILREIYSQSNDEGVLYIPGM